MAVTLAKRIPFARRLASAILVSGLAVALVAAALALTLLLRNVVSTAGYIFFYTAVVLSAWFGGKGPGALATILAILTVEYFFIPPLHSFGVDSGSLPLFIEFAASSATISWFSSYRRQAEAELTHARDELQLRVEERTAELRETNRQLLAEMAERKRAEQAYYEAQAELAHVTRMSAMGALAATISHEVNQPLAAVVTNADACLLWLASDPPNLDEARSAVESIAQQGTRASGIVSRVRAMFAKAAPAESLSLPLNEVIREACALLEVQASRNGVALQMELAGDLPPVRGDRVQLQQVLVNLVLNGIEASAAVKDRPRRVAVSSARLADSLLVAVRDSGPGIDPRHEKRIFDAFFTTKPQGMGMGLSICHSIVEAHGGRLWASANPDHGATLQFTLPIGQESAP